MRLSVAVATGVAGVLLASLLAGKASGGWFGIGGSDKSSEPKAAKTGFYDPNLVASGTKPNSSGNKSSSGGMGSLFGMGKPATSQRSAKKSTSSAPKSKAADKSDDSSWWSSWFKPKQPAPPKSTGEWMKLKPVRY